MTAELVKKGRNFVILGIALDFIRIFLGIKGGLVSLITFGFIFYPLIIYISAGVGADLDKGEKSPLKVRVVLFVLLPVLTGLFLFLADMLGRESLNGSSSEGSIPIISIIFLVLGGLSLILSSYSFYLATKILTEEFKISEFKISGALLVLAIFTTIIVIAGIALSSLPVKAVYFINVVIFIFYFLWLKANHLLAVKLEEQESAEREEVELSPNNPAI